MHLARRFEARFVEDVVAEAPVEDLDAGALDRADVFEEVGEHEGQQRRLREFVPVQADREAPVGDRRIRVRESLARRHLREPEPLVERERREHVRRVHAHFVEAADHGDSRPRRSATQAREALDLRGVVVERGDVLEVDRRRRR